MHYKKENIFILKNIIEKANQAFNMLKISLFVLD